MGEQGGAVWDCRAVMSGRVEGCCVGLQGCGEWESKGVLCGTAGLW